MKIQDVKTKEIYHAPTESAKRQIAAGFAIEVVPPPVYWPNNMMFYVNLTEDGLTPLIAYSCGCGASGTMCGPTAHKTQKVSHCGRQEPVPSATAALYEKYLKRKRAHAERTRNAENTGKLEALRRRP